jgi:hypothetical protein
MPPTMASSMDRPTRVASISAPPGSTGAGDDER